MARQYLEQVDKKYHYHPAMLFEWLHQRSEAVWLILIGPVILFLVLANLAGYPTISGWDEGMYLQFASNLAYHGEYATRSGDTFNRLIPAGGTGPTLIAPVGLALWLSGDSLAAARLVMAAYLLIAIAGAYLLVRQIGGWLAAIVAVLLFLVAGYASYDTLWMSRQVLAEAPSFAFMLLGLWVWIKSWSKKSGWLIAATLLIALSVITKNQLIWVLVPGFALIILANRIYYRQLHWTQEFMPLAGIIIGYVIWLAISLWIVGPTDRASYLETQSALTRASFLHVTPQRWLANLKLLFRSEQWLMALAALIYGFWASRKRSRAGFERLVLPLFAGMAMMSFLVMSLPWARYLYPALALTALCSALLIGDLTRWLTERRKLNGLLTATLLIVIVMLLAGPRLVQNIYRITTTNDNSAEKFAALVEQRVPADSNVLNWEWEIEFYSRRSFTHPPYLLFPALIDQVYNQRNSPILEEPRLPPAIDYLIVGPFATETQVFTSALTQRGHQLLASEGPYQLYQLD